MLKILFRFQKCKKNSSEKVFCFPNIRIGIGYVKLSLLRREYLSLPVSVLTDSLKILHITIRHFLQLSYVHSDQ